MAVTDTGNSGRGAKRPSKLFSNMAGKIAAIPMIFTAVVVFIGCTLWTIYHSFTKSRLLPAPDKWVGLDNYERLWSENRWLISIENLAIYGACSLVLSLVIGFVLAALLDRKIRFENTIRTIILYPFALSFVVTGLVWQWILNPALGLQNVIRSWGWESFSFPRRRHPSMEDLPVHRHPDDASRVRDRARHHLGGYHQGLRLGRRPNLWRSGHRVRSLIPWAYLEFGGKKNG